MSVKFKETIRETDTDRYAGPGRFQDNTSRFDDGPRYRDGPHDQDRYADRMDTEGGGSRFQERSFEETTRVGGERGDRTRDFGDRVSDRVRDFGDRTRENFRDFGDRVRESTRDINDDTQTRTRGGDFKHDSDEHHFGKYGERHHQTRHPTLHRWGEALTKGEGASGYLQAYLRNLEKNPLRTKMLTSGTLAGFQELLASWIAQDRNRDGNYFTSRVPKMAVYGALISAPLGHFMVKLIHFLFAHRTSLRAKIFQILFSNLIVSPIQNTIYLIAMAVIAGAKTFHQIRATVRAGFFPVMRVSWITSPLCLAFAQQFLPEQTWVPFFNIVAFVIGTYINAHTKKKRLAALRRAREQQSGGYGRTTSDYRAGATGGSGEYRTESRSEYEVRGGRGY